MYVSLITLLETSDHTCLPHPGSELSPNYRKLWPTFFLKIISILQWQWTSNIMSVSGAHSWGGELSCAELESEGRVCLPLGLSTVESSSSTSHRSRSSGFSLYWLGRSSLECAIHTGLDLSHEEVCYLIEVEIQTWGPGSTFRGGSITLSRTLADLFFCSQIYILPL